MMVPGWPDGDVSVVSSALAKERSGPPIALQVLAYPVTDAAMDPESQATCANVSMADRQRDAVVLGRLRPDLAVRDEPTASPLRASFEQLAGLPPALLLTDENDVLSDERKE